MSLNNRIRWFVSQSSALALIKLLELHWISARYNRWMMNLTVNILVVNALLLISI